MISCIFLLGRYIYHITNKVESRLFCLVRYIYHTINKVDIFITSRRMDSSQSCRNCKIKRKNGESIQITVYHPHIDTVHGFFVEIATRGHSFVAAMKPSQHFGRVHTILLEKFHISSSSSIKLKVVYCDHNARRLSPSHQHYIPQIPAVLTTESLASVLASIERLAGPTISQLIEKEECDGSQHCQRLYGYCVDHPHYEKNILGNCMDLSNNKE